MRPSLDPLRYGLRALDEMAREQATVGLPPHVVDEHFAPSPLLRPLARDGAAFSLRLFTQEDDDATALVIGAESSQTFKPVPSRAAPLFEAHAAVLAHDGEDELMLGFPLVTFVQQGSARVAPLFSRTARARWMVGETSWSVPPGARVGAMLSVPDTFVLEVPKEVGEATYAVHGGVWFFLFGLDGETLGAISAAGRAGVGPLLRAAARALDGEGEDALREAKFTEAPLTRDELHAFCEVASNRVLPRRGLRCHPHGLAMLPPRGDPTSGLRSELRELLGEPAPERGPLAVYLGARAAPLRTRSVWTCAKVAPTASQLAAARAFEGTADLVAVRGPPGCGKTALLHHVTAQTVVACALGDTWSKAPARSGMPWALVVASTNNAAVDHALAPFVDTPGLPVALRLGNRRTLAEVTAAALAGAIDVLRAAGQGTLAEARAAFEARARPVREYLRERTRTRKACESAADRRRERESRAATLREALARTPDGTPPSVALADLDAAIQALREHAEAASRLAPIHLDGEKPSISRACAKWARANALRGPKIVPILSILSLETPFGELDAAEPREDISRQRRAMESTLVRMQRARDLLAAPEWRRELDELEAALIDTRTDAGPPEPPPDPALVDAALAVRDAWAHAHSAELLARLTAALAAVSAQPSAARGRPPGHALYALAPLFPLAGCTLLSMRTSFPLEECVIDRLVIDEAAQCAPVYALPALARARRAMLTGDTAQLPPVYTLDPRIDERLARGLAEAAVSPFRMGAASTTSAQALVESRAVTRLALVEHFRSHASIVALASRWSGYALDVRTRPRSLASVSPKLASPVIVRWVRGRGERAPEGVVNVAEAAHVVELVLELLHDGVDAADIAVLTPFVGQCVRIERELSARGLLHHPGGVLVSTVHRLQGGERRVVVFSVTATQQRHLRWLAERPHLLHVATSRAQDHLLVVLDPEAAEMEPALAPLREVPTSLSSLA